MPPTRAPETVTAVPRRWRLICAAAAAVVVVVMTVVGVSLRGDTSGVIRYTLADQVAVVALGVIFGGAVLALGRPRVDADATGIRVRNLGPVHAFPWSAVRAVHFDRRFKWATLLLENDDELAILAVQAADGERAAAAAEGLRALLAADRAGRSGTRG